MLRIRGWRSLGSIYIDSHGSPNTLTVSTPSGGLHLYFNYSSKKPDDAEKVRQYLRNKTGFRGKGIDVRSEGGYIVAPPSVVSKKPYKIVSNTAVIDIPSNLIDWLLKDEVTTKTGRIRMTKSPPQPKNGENHVKQATENELEDIKKNYVIAWQQIKLTIIQHGSESA